MATSTNDTEFHNARLGDKVWDRDLEWGIIRDIDGRSDYPIVVDFKSGDPAYFSLDGICKYSIHRSLYWGEVHPVPPPRPKRRVKKTFWVIIFVDSTNNLCSISSSYVFSSQQNARAHIGSTGNNTSICPIEVEVEE